MLSIGPQELAVFGVVILFLIVFGAAKFSSTARDLGQLLGGTKRAVDEVKSRVKRFTAESRTNSAATFRESAEEVTVCG
jgi:Sec-independent protein translocase protein TatA